MLYADHDRDMEKGSAMNKLVDIMKDRVKDIKEVVNFNEYSHLFKSEKPHLWFEIFGENYHYRIWEPTIDGGINEMWCNLDELGRITDAKCIGISYPDEW